MALMGESSELQVDDFIFFKAIHLFFCVVGIKIVIFYT